MQWTFGDAKSNFRNLELNCSKSEMRAQLLSQMHIVSMPFSYQRREGGVLQGSECGRERQRVRAGRPGHSRQGRRPLSASRRSQSFQRGVPASRCSQSMQPVDAASRCSQSLQPVVAASAAGSWPQISLTSAAFD